MGNIVRYWAVSWAAAVTLQGMPAAAQEAAAAAAWVPAPVSSAAANYTVGPGDVIAITVYRSPDLSTQFVVGQDGAIAFPQLGPLQVDGQTSGQISELVERQLRNRGILNDPTVGVTVVRVVSKVVSVMGAVSRAGELPLDRPGMTLSAVLAQAGASFGTGNAVVTVVDGAAPDAPREKLLLGDIVRGSADRAARPGEILIVEAAPMFYVSGEVGRPGAYGKEPNMTVGQALAVAGGVTPRGSNNRIRIMRKAKDGATVKVRSVHLDDKVADGDLILVKTRIF